MAEEGTASFLGPPFYHPSNEPTIAVISTLLLPMTSWKSLGSELQWCACWCLLVDLDAHQGFWGGCYCFCLLSAWSQLYCCWTSCAAGWRSVCAVVGVKWWVPGAFLMSSGTWGCLVLLQGSTCAHWVSRRLWRLEQKDWWMMDGKLVLDNLLSLK